MNIYSWRLNFSSLFVMGKIKMNGISVRISSQFWYTFLSNSGGGHARIYTPGLLHIRPTWKTDSSTESLSLDSAPSPWEEVRATDLLSDWIDRESGSTTFL